MGTKVVVLEQYHGLLFASGVPKLTTTRRSSPPTMTRNFFQIFSNQGSLYSQGLAMFCFRLRRSKPAFLMYLSTALGFI